jgi:hypothetical protein
VHFYRHRSSVRRQLDGSEVFYTIFGGRVDTFGWHVGIGLPPYRARIISEPAWRLVVATFDDRFDYFTWHVPSRIFVLVYGLFEKIAKRFAMSSKVGTQTD